MQFAGAVPARLVAPGLDGLVQLVGVGTVFFRERLEKGQAAGLVEAVIAVEHAARDNAAGGFAATGQQFAAQLDEV